MCQNEFAIYDLLTIYFLYVLSSNCFLCHIFTSKSIAIARKIDFQISSTYALRDDNHLLILLLVVVAAVSPIPYTLSLAGSRILSQYPWRIIAILLTIPLNESRIIIIIPFPPTHDKKPLFVYLRLLLLILPRLNIPIHFISFPLMPRDPPNQLYYSFHSLFFF